jgi:hypothetical protein
MQYPNVGAPSPQEIYEGLKMIPNNAQGKQMLTQLAQQGKQTGSIEGGIATAILNSYNKAQPTPPPPQGQVVDQVLAQAQPQPMFDPNAMGIAAPGLEQMAQQNAQQMATGGLVALAQGGPVREFGIGGLTDAWMGGMPDVPEAPDTTQYENDYFSAPEAHPAEMLSTVTSRNVGKGESDKPSFEERVNKLGELYGDMPDVAAQLISEHEHRQAQRSKFNMFENIASGLAGYLGSYGSGEHRAGAGLASMMATMGEHRRAEDEGQTALDALRVKSAMQPYEIRKDLIHQVQSAQTAHDKAQAEATLKAFELMEQRKTEMMKQRYQTGREEMEGETSREVAGIHADATRYSADQRGDKTGPAGMTWNQAYERAEKQVLTDPAYMKLEKSRPMIDAMAKEFYNKGRVESAAPAGQSATSGWNPIPGLNYGYLSGPSR